MQKTNQEIINNNSIIAKFLGGEVDVILKIQDKETKAWKGDIAAQWRKDKQNLSLGNAILCEHLEFHKSWEWLMPVVEKIGKELGYRVTIDTVFTRIWRETNEIEYRNLTTSLECTYLAVVDFIKWYNKK
jgi:hypothetical protein